MAIQFTRSAQEALQQAQAEAIRRENQEIYPSHLLRALISTGESGIVPNLVQVTGASLPALRERTESALRALPAVSGSGSGQIYASGALNRVMVLAEDEAKKLGDEYRFRRAFPARAAQAPS